MNIVFTLIISSAIVSLLSYSKNTKDDNLILKFDERYTNISTIFYLTTSILFWATIGFMLFKVDKNDISQVTNTLSLSILIFCFHLLSALFYSYLHKKLISVEDNKITAKSLFTKAIIFNFEDIEKVEDFPGNKLELILRLNQKVLVDYQLTNVEAFKDVLKSKNIMIVNNAGRETW
jgi:hypothetical protein